MASGGTTQRPYTHVAAEATVAGEMPDASPAALATRPAVAAPKARPNDCMVGIDEAVTAASPGRAEDIVQLLICAKQRPMPAPVIATEAARSARGPSTTIRA